VLPILTTERLVLRPWRAGDVDAAADIYSRWEVQRYLGAQPAVDADRAVSEARVLRWAAFAGPLHGVWAIVPQGSDRPVGSALCKLLPRSGTGEPSPDTEIGWHLHPDCWGRGYATEAGRRLLRHAADHGVAEVFAVTYPDNAASQAVCRRVGLEFLSLTDRYYDMECALFRSGPTVPEPAGP
jgi:RimJ/RimL family protein N-acetyltransferase